MVPGIHTVYTLVYAQLEYALLSRAPVVCNKARGVALAPEILYLAPLSIVTKQEPLRTKQASDLEARVLTLSREGRSHTSPDSAAIVASMEVYLLNYEPTTQASPLATALMESLMAADDEWIQLLRQDSSLMHV